MSYESVKMDNEGSNDLRRASQKQLANLLRDLLDADDSSEGEGRSGETSSESIDDSQSSKQESQEPPDSKT